MYSDFEIRQVPLSIKSQRTKVEQFLAANGLRLETVDYYAAVFECDGDEILAGGGLDGDVLKCIAVSDALRDTGMSLCLVSHLLSVAQSQGYFHEKVYTKPENRKIFESASFHTIAESDKAILLENSDGLERYCKYLAKKYRPGKNGVIVMNANPFTLGHRYLIETAAQKVDTLYILAVKDDRSQFTCNERLEMIKAGCCDIGNVIVCDGSDYAVSATTFPTYFLKKIEDATDTQITLDLYLFSHYIAPALGATIRFVGSETTTDPTTTRYNELMHQLLPVAKIKVVEIPRLESGGQAVSASRVRALLQEGCFRNAAQLVYPSTWPFLISQVAQQALQTEIDTTPKPGLVDRHDTGAHRDMDYALMRKSIQALRPFFNQLAIIGAQEALPQVAELKSIGLVAEKAMLEATSGVNTHKGALFSMGLAVVVASHLQSTRGLIDAQALHEGIISLAKQFTEPAGTHGAQVIVKHKVGGALACAMSGYEPLFTTWLPYFGANLDDPYRHHKTLLLIMTALDDTNIFYRCGSEVAQQAKEEAKRVFNDFSMEALEEMNRSFVQRNISPGGAADMLSLTVFVHIVTN